MGLYVSHQNLKRQRLPHRKKARAVRPVFIFLLLLSITSLVTVKLSGSNSLREKKYTPSFSQCESKTPSESCPSQDGFTDFIEKSFADTTIVPQNMLEGRIDEGGSIYKCLQEAGITDRDIQSITDSLKPLFDFRTKSRPGDSFRLILSQDGKIERFEYQRGPLDIYFLTRDNEDNWNSWRQNIKLAKYWERVSGQITGSLFSTLQEKGYPASLAVQFAEILEWKIDFQHEVRQGDRFELIVERFFKEQEPVGYGKVLAVMYDGVNTGLLKGFYFEYGDGRSDYYSKDGMSLRQAFLKAPLSYKYISSGFTYHRKHPILGRVRPHLGVDFAAPYGSPVWAVADGTVISKSYDRNNGNQIKIRHMNNYITYYNHLSRFARRLKKGTRVTQKQVIGYVGTTGLSTGPHLDYRVKKDGRFINPLTARYPSGKPLEKASKPDFKALVAELDPMLTGDDSLTRILVAEVNSAEVFLSKL